MSIFRLQQAGAYHRVFCPGSLQGRMVRRVLRHLERRSLLPRKSAQSGNRHHPAALPSYQRLARDLAAQVFAGTLVRGQKLPAEVELSRQHRVSRGTLRAAMALLEDQGIVHRIRGHGTFVADDQQAAGKWFSTAGTILYIQSGPGGALQPHGYYCRILFGARQTVEHLGMTLRLEQVAAPVKVPIMRYSPPRPEEVCGVILAGTFDDDYIGMYLSERVPIVVVDYLAHDPRVDCVTVDVEGEAYLAIEHLGQLGHTSLAFMVSSRRDPRTGARRLDPDAWRLLDSLRRAGRDYHVEIRDEWVIQIPHGEPSPQEAAACYLSLKQRPHALLCFDEQVAGPMMRAVAQKLLRCPEDVSIMTRAPEGDERIDGVPVTCLCNVPELLGEAAVKLLSQRIRGQRSPAWRLAAASRLVRGKTTATPTASPAVGQVPQQG